ncbi:MAG TPA: hypothetical protein VK721_05055 [Solirubrobacteraceae bacterium]|nr:hypothetical protein [Solirubrobacteraceae bacterium]
MVDGRSFHEIGNHVGSPRQTTDFESVSFFTTTSGEIDTVAGTASSWASVEAGFSLADRLFAELPPPQPARLQASKQKAISAQGRVSERFDIDFIACSTEYLYDEFAVKFRLVWFKLDADCARCSFVCAFIIDSEPRRGGFQLFYDRPFF